jgi:hypothetical protein
VVLLVAGRARGAAPHALEAKLDQVVEISSSEKAQEPVIISAAM